MPRAYTTRTSPSRQSGSAQPARTGRHSDSRRAAGPGRPRRGAESRTAGVGSSGARPTTPLTSSRAAADEFEAAFAAAAEAAAAQDAAPLEDFAAAGLSAPLVDALVRRGIRVPTPIQARALPDALAGRNVLGRAQTGSGKTLAFGLPMLTRLAGTRPTAGAPRGLVLVPTRELAQQVHDALAPLGAAVGVRLTTVYGGASMKRQIDALRGGVDAVIATPGRLHDLIGQGECRLDRVEVTVLDEADYMTDLGFLPTITALLEQVPAGGQRLLFSATLDGGVGALVRRFVPAPATHAVAPAAAPVDTMEHRAYVVDAAEKVAVTAAIAARPARTLLFVRTKHGADRLAKQLHREGVEAGAIHGNLTQSARQRALDAFASGASRVLVATDVAARGIHVDDVDLVVHVDPPADAKDYLHRAGRTARAGATGMVLSLLQREQVREAKRLFDRAGVPVQPVPVDPTSAAVRELATSGTPVVPPPPTPPAERAQRASRSSGPRRRPRRPSGGGRYDRARAA